MTEDNKDVQQEAKEAKEKLGISKSVDERIAKLKNNQYQYASAGDTKSLIEEIERLRNVIDNPKKKELNPKLIWHEDKVPNKEKSLRIMKDGYDFTFSYDGYIGALTAGDQGWEVTGFKIYDLAETCLAVVREHYEWK